MLEHSKMPGDPSRGIQLDLVPLAVIEGERITFEAVASGDSEAGGRIEPSAQFRTRLS